MSPSPRWPALVLASMLAMGLLVLIGAHGAPRAGLALWFLLACPGLAIVPLLPPVPPVAQLALVAAVSLAIDTLVVTTMLVAGTFSPAVGVLAVTIACLAGSAAQLVTWSARRPVDEIRFLE